MTQNSQEATNCLPELETAKNCFEHYLNVFNIDDRIFREELAPNAVLEWFGRTIAGSDKIHNFLRYEFCAQYKHHNFSTALPCAAIERRCTHQKTKILSNRHTHKRNPLNKVPTGISSLKTYADSDMEDADHEDEYMGMTHLRDGAQTPERNTSTCIEELTPPSSAIKQDDANVANATFESSEEEEEKEDTGVEAKRPKLMPETKATNRKNKKRSKDKVARTLLDDSSNSEAEPEHDADAEQSMEQFYTPLQYIEANGMLQSLEDSGAYQCMWDREVRIQISYRKHLITHDLQYALIIYEHMEPIQRTQPRSLTNVFEQLANSASIADNNIVEEDNIAEVLTPALVVNEANETVVATVSTPTTEEIAAALETATFAVAPNMRTPTKTMHTPPSTPKRKPRSQHQSSSLKRYFGTLSGTPAPQRKAARSLRL